MNSKHLNSDEKEFCLKRKNTAIEIVNALSKRKKLLLKLNKCFETDPDNWRGVNDDGLQLLSLLDLKCFRNEFPDEENLQDKWEAAVTNPGKYVNLLVGQRDDEDLRAEIDEDNYYDSSPWDQKTKNFILAYHQVKAQAHWFASRPDEAEQYKDSR